MHRKAKQRYPFKGDAMNKWLMIGLIALMLTPIIVTADWLYYDNGVDWSQIFAVGVDNGYGVKFDPQDTGLITKVRAYIGRHTPPVWNGFKIQLFDWNGTLEQPGNLVADRGELIGSGNGDNWFVLDFPNKEWNSTDPFVIAFLNIYGEEEVVDTIYVDSNGVSGSGLYWYRLNGSWQQYNPSGDLLVRVWFSGSPVESTSLGAIKATFK